MLPPCGGELRWPISADRLTCTGPKRISGRCDRLVDVILGVGGGDKSGLELAARQVDAASEHLPEEPGEEPGVAPAGIVVVVYGAVVEKEGQHAADALDDMGHSGVGRGAVESFGQPGGKCLEPFVRGLSRSSRKVARPAAMARGFPESVPAW